MNKPQSNKKIVILFLLLATIVSAPSYSYQERERPKGPPPEAIEACVDLSEGDAVSFKSRRGDVIEATCQLVQEKLVAVPNNHEKRRKD